VKTESDKLMGLASAGHAPDGLAAAGLAGASAVSGSAGPDGLLAMTVGAEEGE
jgi:hypothetical protein